MNRSLSLAPPFLMILSGLVSVGHSQTSMQLPGCEVNPAAHRAMDRDLDPAALDRMTYADRIAFERRTLEGLIAQYPRELAPYTRMRDLLHQYAPEEYKRLRDSWIRMGKEHPDDPLALLLEGEALDGLDTPESIRVLEMAKAKAPEFPWPDRDLAGIYAQGKVANPAKAKENIDAFFAVCPTSWDPYALYLLPQADPSLQATVTAARAAALRAKLAGETDPKQLERYASVWTLEFRARKPGEYGAERERIAEDLARLEKIHPKGDAAWQAMLIGGYKLSGAAKEKVAALENQLIADYPHSDQAYTIVSDRWDKAHPEPQDQRDAAAWDQHRKVYEEALREWIRDYPDDTYLQRFAWFSAVEDDDKMPRAEALAAVDGFLRAVDRYYGPSWRWAYYPDAAELLVERGWEPNRAIDLLQQAKANYTSNWERDAGDNRSAEEVQRGLNWQREQTQYLDGLMLKAAMEARKPEIAAELRSEVEAAPPEDKKLLSGYWTNRARAGLLAGNTMDALAYYQVALETRIQPPKPSEGTVHDDLGDEAHALWKQEGGTETAWGSWSRMPAKDTTVRAEGRWEKPKKPMPDFALTDLSGKTWRLKELHGRTVLIDVWATWCGPCQAELPNLQKLYEQVKDRKDIQILTFDYDSNPGSVGPYLRDHGYTFPVLPIADAAEIEDAVNDTGIPQNWILNRSGAAAWRQVGYEPEAYADFAKDMLTRMGATAP